MYILKIKITEKSEYSLEADLFHTQNIPMIKCPAKEDIVRIARKHCDFAYYGLGAEIEIEIYSSNIDSDGVVTESELIEKFEVNCWEDDV